MWKDPILGDEPGAQEIQPTGELALPWFGT